MLVSSRVAVTVVTAAQVVSGLVGARMLHIKQAPELAAATAPAETVEQPAPHDVLLTEALNASSNPADLERTREVFEELAASDPDSASARTAVGVVLQAQGEDQAARAWYVDALMIDPRSGIAARNLASIIVTGPETETAVRWAEVAVEQLPEDARAHGTLGWALFKSGRPGLALSELERASTLNPAEPAYHRQLDQIRRALALPPD